MFVPLSRSMIDEIQQIVLPSLGFSSKQIVRLSRSFIAERRLLYARKYFEILRAFMAMEIDGYLSSVLFCEGEGEVTVFGSNRWDRRN